MIASSAEGDFREDRIRLLKICDILHKYKQLPSTWQEVTQHHVDLIVKALAKRKYSASSIMNYLRSLRKLLSKSRASYQVPMPKQLGLVKKTHEPILKNTALDILDKINNPTVKKIIGLEILFGLKKREAMQLVTVFSCQSDVLYVPIGISSNNTDRYIPIQTQPQIAFIKEIGEHDGTDTPLLSLYQYASLSAVYQNYIKMLGIPSNVQYRYIYANWRFRYLKDEHANKLYRLKKVANELGVSIQHIRKILHEQSIT